MRHEPPRRCEARGAFGRGLVSVQVVVLSAALALYGVNPNFALTV